MHLNTVAVTVGQSVGQGQLLGGAGCTGFATGVHLHFQRDVNKQPAKVYFAEYPGQQLSVGQMVTSRNGAASVTPAPTAPASNRLLSGQQMLPGQSITSANGCFRFIYQTDGNLVLYRMSGYQPLWASNTSGRSARNAIMQTDGNLVVYDASGTPVWSSRTNGNSGSWLIVQSDGNVVIYRPNGGPAIWATNTVRAC